MPTRRPRTSLPNLPKKSPWRTRQLSSSLRPVSYTNLQMVNNNNGVGLGADDETEEPAEGAKKNKVVICAQADTVVVVHHLRCV